jgi:hypothetical protein
VDQVGVEQSLKWNGCSGAEVKIKLECLILRFETDAYIQGTVRDGIGCQS